MSGKMTRWPELTVLFTGEGKERRPSALTAKRPPLGARITVRVDPECLVTRAAYLVSRNNSDLILTASLREEQAEASRLALGQSRTAYRVVKVEVLDDSFAELEQDFSGLDARRARAARRLLDVRVARKSEQ